MKKLWQKNNQLHAFIEEFTVGSDFLLDQGLVEFDCLASIVHAKALEKAGMVSKKEFKQLKKALLEVIELNKKGKFVLMQGNEDSHTKIENFLAKKTGNAGKKIHAGRSRNDQVIAMLRLHAKKELIETEKLLLELASAMHSFALKHEFTPLPGYSHMKQAMPSSFGLWASAFAESLLENLKALDFAFSLIDQNPLGSCAGFGSSLDLDREHSTKLLGFKKLQKNSLYVQNSRGKFEAGLIFSLAFTAMDLNKLATDLLLYSTEEFGFVSFSEGICTGSSAMPHKKNLDVLELMRAKSNLLASNLFQTFAVVSSLPSGYNRDFQLTKKPLIESFGLLKHCLKVAKLVFESIEVNEEKILESFSEGIFSADIAIELAKQGIPFRKAFMQSKKKGLKPSKKLLLKNLKSKKSIGMPGNLGLKHLLKEINAKQKEIKGMEAKFASALSLIQKL